MRTPTYSYIWPYIFFIRPYNFAFIFLFSYELTIGKVNEKQNSSKKIKLMKKEFSTIKKKVKKFKKD